ncbi:serine/threonine-protein kinase BLUS1-like [Impatiens glandulifera]|uniref:serine/threonine-protein kinase BLUS1-like n=1 Tax=Impatiens glandulifera TaxID=253017 RepID=UPI001FB0F350|nr:serine/threonine-protein kinase BLUS1-like [Impatiens glandulifera]
MDNKELKFPIDANSYRIIHEIGRGKNSHVYRALCLPLNMYVVIKAINLDQSSDLDEGIQKASTKFNSVRNHPNILSSYCIFAVDSQVWVVMPSISAGSLQSIISYSFPNGLPEDCIVIILRQTLNLLYYLHFDQIVHNDLKAGNILLDHNGEIKFADFGLSACLSNISSPSYSCSLLETPQIPNISGRPYWLAPEVSYSSDGFSVKTDIWSFGILALELAHGKPPLSDVDGYLSPSLTKKINERFLIGNYENHMNSFCSEKRFSESFKDLVNQCLKQDPGNRPSLDGLQKHSFFKSWNSDTSLLVKKMLNVLPSLEHRFMHSMERFRYTMDEDEVDEEEVKWRISGWDLNVEILKLCPILHSVSVNSREARHVQFGGEIIIDLAEKDEEEEEEEESENENELWEKYMSKQFAALSLELNDMGDQMDELSEKKWKKEETEATLHSVKRNLEEQLSRVNDLILAHGGGVVLHDDEDELTGVVNNCYMDMENELEDEVILAPGTATELLRELIEKQKKVDSDLDMELDRLSNMLTDNNNNNN